MVGTVSTPKWCETGLVDLASTAPGADGRVPPRSRMAAGNDVLETLDILQGQDSCILQERNDADEDGTHRPGSDDEKRCNAEIY